jgi:ribosomal protein L11 methyltransferase
VTQSWKVSLPCTRGEAEALAADIGPLAALDPPPALMTSEVDGERPEVWRLDAYFETKPDRRTVALLKAQVPSAAGAEPSIEPVAEQDWVSLSQSGLEPIRAGRFFVHTPVHRGEVPQGAVAIEIEAGRAFGTGHHETTAGCLEALDAMRSQGLGFSNVLDLGSGTGLLAFAALRLWPVARVTASDIDPVAAEVSREAAAANRVPIGRARGQVEILTAPGLFHPRLVAKAPYDLVIANILAAPLVELAPAVGAALEPGGRLVLAGLLTRQAGAVASAYRRQGLSLSRSESRGNWPTLVMRKRRSFAWR